MAQVLRKRPCKCSNPKTCPHRQWTARYFYEGKQRERSFKTKTDADDFVAKFEHDKRESIFVDPRNGRITFTEYAERWIEDSSKSVGTKATYRSVLNAQIRPVLGTRSLAQVAADREGVWSLVSGMTGSSSRKSACLTVIKGACDEAVRAGKIPSHRLDCG